LTTRRLFVRTGFFRRRIDQIELLRVKDLFVQQTLLAKWLGLGHVIVISSEQTLPRAVLYGVDRPQSVMDLIWLKTRAELDNKTSRVERV
jgi:Bacterial PH domain